jgi:hypothetical protein
MTDNAVEDKSRVMDLQSVLTCPKCGHQSVETMPIDACQFFYDSRLRRAAEAARGRLLRVLLLRLAALTADADRPLLVSADSSIDADQRGVEAPSSPRLRGGPFQFAALVLDCPSRQLPLMPVIGDADVDMGQNLVASLVDVSHLAVIGPALAFEKVKLLQGGIIDVINLAGNGKRWEPEVSGDCIQDDGENTGRDHPIGSQRFGFTYELAHFE